MSWSLAPVIMSDYVGRRKMLHMKLRLLMGFLRWCSGKEPSFQSRSCKRPRFGPWVRKILWRRKWQPAAVFLPGKSHGQRSLVGYSPGGCKELDAAESLSTYTCTHSQEIVVNHLGWPSVINKDSHQRTRRQKIESEGGDVGGWLFVVDLEDGGMGPGAQQCGWPPKIWKGKGSFDLRVPRELSSADTFILAW